MAAGGTLGLPSGIPSDSLLELTKGFEVGEHGISGQSVPALDYNDFSRRVSKQIAEAESHFMLQREKMQEAWKFYDGHQLSDADLQALKALKRPDTAINEMQKFIKFASGIERRTPQALMFAARSVEDQQAQIKGELCGKFFEYFAKESSATYERSLAFESMLVCGLGITDCGLSRKRDPQGRPRYNYCDSAQFLFPECSRQNWALDTDSPIPWIGRETWMDVEEAVNRWPDSALFLRASSGTGNEDQFPSFGKGAKRPINYVVPWIMTEPLNKGGGSDEDKPGKVKILEWQCYEDTPGYYFFDPVQRDAAWLSDSDFRKLRNRYQLLFHQQITDYDRHLKRLYRRAFLLNRRIMLEGPKDLEPVTGDAGYTWNVMTGAWDHHDKVWVGKTALFMAPQRYANAMFRQVLEILGSSHKNGAFAETQAMTVAQKRDYEERGAAPGAINFVQPGAISNNRILLKSIPQLPQGTMEVLGFCIDMMDKVSGLSTSLLGQDQSNTPGVSLRRRLTSGMVLLAADFDALSRFRRREGQLVFELLKLIADDRVVRIGGAFDGQALKLIRDPFALDYDIELDEIENDPNLRAYYTDQIMAIAPILVRTGNFIPELLDYVNLPVQFRQALKDGIQRSEEQKMQMVMQGISPGGRGKPRGLEEMKADTQLKQARAAEHAAKARATMAGIGRENLRGVFDAVKGAHEMYRDDRSMNIDLLGKLFDVLKERQKGNGAEKK